VGELNSEGYRGKSPNNGTFRENWPCIRVLSVVRGIIAATQFLLDQRQTISSQTIKQGTHIFYASPDLFLFTIVPILGTSCQIRALSVPMAHGAHTLSILNQQLEV